MLRKALILFAFFGCLSAAYAAKDDEPSPAAKCIAACIAANGYENADVCVSFCTKPT